MEQEKITKTKKGLMITIALVIDGIQSGVSMLHLIPLVGNLIALFSNAFITIFAYMTFGFWFALNGIYIFKKPRGAATFALTLIIESIPLIRILPSFSFWVWRTLTLHEIKKVLPKKTTSSRIRRIARSKRASNIEKFPKRNKPEDFAEAA